MRPPAATGWGRAPELNSMVKVTTVANPGDAPRRVDIGRLPLLIGDNDHACSRALKRFLLEHRHSPGKEGFMARKLQEWMIGRQSVSTI